MTKTAEEFVMGDAHLFLPHDATHSAEYAVARCMSVVCLFVCHTHTDCNKSYVIYQMALF